MEILKGKPVADAISKQTAEGVCELKKRGIVPALAIVRVGDNKDDIAYENGAVKRCSGVGIEVRKVTFEKNVSEEDFIKKLDELSNDDTVHGILMLQPLPEGIDTEKARRHINPQKDIDGTTGDSLVGVFTGTDVGFAPCTPQAAMEILKFYNIEISGKRAVVIGRSLVVGRPVACMLMQENATVTVCHTRTKDVPALTREADIIIAASGRMESIGEEYFSKDKEQTVIDVGIAWNDKKQKLCGDVDFESAEGRVSRLTPVPGGVGTVTNSILSSHVVQAAERMVMRKR